MITARWPILAAILFWICSGHVCLCSWGSEYELIPIRSGDDLTRGNKRVLVTMPKGWEKRGVSEYEVGFGLAGQTRNPADPAIIVLANHKSRRYSAKLTPRNSYMGVNLETDISELKHIESFDAGANGRLMIWRFRTYNRNYVLTLIVQPDTEGRTEVDVYLESKDAHQLMRYLNALKEVARSVRIVDR